MKKLTLAILILMVWMGSGWAATYYVSFTNGDDTRNATQAQVPSTPWKHHPDSNLATSNCQTKRATLTGNDVIVMARGETWWGTHLSTNAAGTGVGAEILTTSTDTFGTGAYPIIASATQYPSGWTLYAGTTYSIADSVQANACWDGDTELVLGSSKDALTTNQFFWESNILYVNVSGDPGSGHSIEAGMNTPLSMGHNYRKYTYLAFKDSNDASGFGAIYDSGHTGVIIDHCNISKTSCGVRLNGSTSPIVSHCVMSGRSTANWGSAGISGTGATTGATITGNTISNFIGHGASVAGTSSGWTITSNTFDNNVGYGAMLSYGTNHLVKDNVFTRNGQYRRYGASSNTYGGYNYGSDGGGVNIAGASGTWVINNEFSNHNYGGVSLASTGDLTANNVIAYNVISGCLVNPITTFGREGASFANIIENNTVIHQPHYQDSTTLLTVPFKSAAAWTGKSESPLASNGFHGHGWSFQGAASYIHNSVARNNIIVIGTLDHASVGNDVSYITVTTTGTAYKYAIDNNLYFDASESASPAGFWSYATTTYTTDATYKAAIAVDANITGKDAHMIFSNPLFLSVTNYGLNPGSPASKSGYYDPLLHGVSGVVDMLGVQINSMAMHIGAYPIVRSNGDVVYYPTIRY